MGTAAGAGRPHTDPQVCRGLSPLGLQAGCSVPLRLPRSSTRGRLGWTAAMPASHPSSVFPPPPHTPQHSQHSGHGPSLQLPCQTLPTHRAHALTRVHPGRGAASPDGGFLTASSESTPLSAKITASPHPALFSPQ